MVLVCYGCGCCCFGLFLMLFFFFFKQKTAYEMRISDWSSDVCSSDLAQELAARAGQRSTSARRAALERELAELKARETEHGLVLTLGDVLLDRKSVV